MEISLLSIGALTGVVLISGAFFYSYSKQKKPSPRKLRSAKVMVLLHIINVLDAYLKPFGTRIFRFKNKEVIKGAQDIIAMPGSYEIFGDQTEFVKGTELFVKCLREDLMSASGIAILSGLILRIQETRRDATKYIISHPEICNSVIRKPMFISGIGRTGSTMLYNLMSCDPKVRAPRFFEMCQMCSPSPPVSSAEQLKTDPRIKECTDRFDSLEKFYEGMFVEAGKSHRSHPAEIEEDILVLFHGMILQLHVPLTLGRDDSFRRWFEDPTNKRHLYRYHKRFLQMMNHAWTPESHWVLKAPMHCTYLDAVLEEYPDANFVFTHRNPIATNPSWVKLTESYMRWSYGDNECDLHYFAKYLKEANLQMADRMLEFRAKVDKSKYIDICYDTFMKDPIETVRKIYTYFGLEFSEEFKHNMKVWIEENRQGKYGRAVYTLEEYGFNEDQLKEEFADYIKLIEECR